MCGKCDDGSYPVYGVGPHRCFYKIPGAIIGESEVIDDLPDNYVEDKDCPGLGVWYCPECKEGMCD